MTKKKEAGAMPRRYDEAFKQEAVCLWKSSGRSAEQTAQELGISVFNLYTWGNGQTSWPGPPGRLVRP